MKRSTSKGLIALISTSLIWGSSFPIIKIVVMNISDYTYVWLRSLIAICGLMPYILYYMAKVCIDEVSCKPFTVGVRGGLLAGIFYALGLWLQGLGTRYTTASNSAFITGLSIVFVHLYSYFILRRYSLKLILSLALALSGLYLLTMPSGGLNIGDILVLMGSFMWASQIIIIDRFSMSNPLIFTFFEMIPAISFIIPDVLFNSLKTIETLYIIEIAYLALICSNIAFALQVYGQRFISPAIAALIFLLEPVSASFFAYLFLHEIMKITQLCGASLILMGMYVASLDKALLEK